VDALKAGATLVLPNLLTPWWSAPEPIGSATKIYEDANFGVGFTLVALTSPSQRDTSLGFTRTGPLRAVCYRNRYLNDFTIWNYALVDPRV
jgi:hypothetical protein